MADKETLATLAVGGLVTAAFTYVTSMFMKRSDKVDELEKRITSLEIATSDIKYIKEKQANVDHKIDQILEMLMEFRIQINASRSRNTQIGDNNSNG